MSNFYVYVDESGQHKNGELFIVGVVVVIGDQHEKLQRALLVIEERSGKGQRKWAKCRDKERAAYLELVLASKDVVGCLFFKMYTGINYTEHLVDATAQAIKTVGTTQDDKVIVLVDGEPQNDFGVRLRRKGVSPEKVRGIDDKTDPLLRLADAVCGLVYQSRKDKPKKPKMGELLEQAIKLIDHLP